MLKRQQEQRKQDSEKRAARQANEEGNALFERGDYAGAALKYQMALKHAPNDLVIQSNLAMARDMLAQQKAKQEALRLAGKAKELRDRDDLQGYFRHLRQAIKIDPSNVGIRDELTGQLSQYAPSLLERDDIHGAIEVYREILALNPPYFIVESIARKQLAKLEAELESRNRLAGAMKRKGFDRARTEAFESFVQDDLLGAIAKFRGVLTLDPSNDDVRRALEIARQKMARETTLQSVAQLP